MARLESADVVILGEIHDDHSCHWMQADIIRNLINGGRAPVLYFEMLTDQEEVAHEDFLRTWADNLNGSSIIKDAARGRILAWEKRGWPVWEAYAPIFQLSDQYGLPVRHADPSPELMRNVRRFGLLAIPKQLRIRLFENLKEGEISELSGRLTRTIADAHRQEPDSPGQAGLIQAQMTRDAYMALRLSQAERPAVLIAGMEHARKDHGVPFHLGLRASHLNVVAIAPCGALATSHEPVSPGLRTFDFYRAAGSAEWRHLDHDEKLPILKE